MFGSELKVEPSHANREIEPLTCAQKIALLGNQRPQSCFTAHNHDHALRRVDGVDGAVSAGRQPYRPVPTGFEHLQCSSDVRDASDGNQCGRTRRAGFDARRDSRGSVLRYDHAPHPGPVGGSQQRPEIVGVLDLVSNNQESGRRRQHLLQFGIRKRRRHRNDSLVAGPADQGGECLRT